MAVCSITHWLSSPPALLKIKQLWAREVMSSVAITIIIVTIALVPLSTPTTPPPLQIPTRPSPPLLPSGRSESWMWCGSVGVARHLWPSPALSGLHRLRLIVWGDVDNHNTGRARELLLNRNGQRGGALRSGYCWKRKKKRGSVDVSLVWEEVGVLLVSEWGMGSGGIWLFLEASPQYKAKICFIFFWFPSPSFKHHGKDLSFSSPCCHHELQILETEVKVLEQLFMLIQLADASV